jgi:hypothetical protein
MLVVTPATTNSVRNVAVRACRVVARGWREAVMATCRWPASMMRRARSSSDWGSMRMQSMPGWVELRATVIVGTKDAECSMARDETRPEATMMPPTECPRRFSTAST